MKTKLTTEFENRLFSHIQKMGTYCVFECQLGNYFSHKKQVVYCVSIDTKNIVKCYEIKTVKSDFYSKNGHNFLGNFNYYVMPFNVYKQVKDDIPYDIGVLVEDGYNKLRSIKKAKYCDNKCGDIKDFMLRSLYREYQKWFYHRNDIK